MTKVHALRFATSFAAAWLALPAASEAQTNHVLYNCATRVTGALRDFTTDLLHETQTCERERITGTGPADCATDPDLLDLIASLADTVADEIDYGTEAQERCRAETARALCALESRNKDILLRVITDPGPQPPTTRSQLGSLVADLFVTPYEGCARPSSRPSAAILECAKEIADSAEGQAEKLEQCFFSCERANLGDSEACVNGDGGAPAADSVAECVAKEMDTVADLASRCNDAEVVALGCPLGARTAADLVAALATRLATFAQQLSFDVFHSSCRTSITQPPPQLVPAEVTLEPSQTRKQVSCGQVLDAAFFGSDRMLKFDTDLNCGPITQASHGIVVAKTGVTISGRSRTWSISGPTKRTLRTGAGILVAPGVKRVTINGFKKIQNFAFGVLDSGDNRGIRVQNSTLFRNNDAGVRSASRKTKITSVIVDRNGIGLDISGDNSAIKTSEIRSSDRQSISSAAPISPGIGVRLGGSDVDGNGVAVRLQATSFEGNRIGLVIDGSAHVVEQNTVRTSVTDGIQLAGTGVELESNSIKTSGGHGVIVSGSGNRVGSNHSDENAGAGFVISGTDNEVENNGAGSPTDNGNALEGYRITGLGNRLDSNRAEANLRAGFSVRAATGLFKGNRAEGNAGPGFDVVAAGNGIESNAASVNGGAEFSIAPDNADLTGNRANGTGFSFDATGAVVD